MKLKKAGICLLVLTVMSIATAGMLRAEEAANAPCPKKVAVVLEAVKPMDFNEYHYFSAIGQPEVIAVKSPVGGLLSELKVSEGSLVDSGQELAVLNAGMDEELKVLEAAAAKAKKILTARQNWKEKSEKAIQSAAAEYQKALDALNAKKAQANVTVTAPVAGIVRLVTASEGEVAAADLLLEISNPRQMIFQAPVTDANRRFLAVGDRFSGDFEAEVIAASDSQVSLRVNNEGNVVKEGAQYTFKKLKSEHAGVIVIPSAAVQKDSLGDFVYVAEKKRAKKLYVTIGAMSEGKSLVEKGLAAGTPLIVSGLECLMEGKKIRVVNQEELDKEKAEARAKEKSKTEAELKAKAEAERKEKEAAKEEKKAAEAEVQPEKPAAEEKPAGEKESRFRIGLVFGRFTVNDENMKEFYGNWFKNIPGAEVSIHTFQRIDVWASYKMFSNERTTTYFGDPVKFKLSPLSIGLRYRFPKWRFLEPFAGAGLNFYSYKETIGGESDLEDTKGSATGFHFQGGTYFHLKKIRMLLGEVFFKYNMVKKTLDQPLPDGSDQIDLGGLEIGVGLVVKF